MMKFRWSWEWWRQFADKAAWASVAALVWMLCVAFLLLAVTLVARGIVWLWPF